MGMKSGPIRPAHRRYSRPGFILPGASFPPRQWTFVAAVLHDVMTVVLPGSSLKDDLPLAWTCGATKFLGNAGYYRVSGRSGDLEPMIWILFLEELTLEPSFESGIPSPLEPEDQDEGGIYLEFAPPQPGKYGSRGLRSKNLAWSLRTPESGLGAAVSIHPKLPFDLPEDSIGKALQSTDSRFPKITMMSEPRHPLKSQTRARRARSSLEKRRRVQHGHRWKSWMRSASQSFGLEIPVDMDARSKVHAADFHIWKSSHLTLPTATGSGGIRSDHPPWPHWCGFSASNENGFQHLSLDVHCPQQTRRHIEETDRPPTWLGAILGTRPQCQLAVQMPPHETSAVQKRQDEPPKGRIPDVRPLFQDLQEVASKDGFTRWFGQDGPGKPGRRRSAMRRQCTGWKDLKVGCYRPGTNDIQKLSYCSAYLPVSWMTWPASACWKPEDRPPTGRSHTRPEWDLITIGLASAMVSSDQRVGSLPGLNLPYRYGLRFGKCNPPPPRRENRDTKRSARAAVGGLPGKRRPRLRLYASFISTSNASPPALSLVSTACVR
ncbi:hypothetical protein B0H14DRAFT_2567128 [Mycena olivaceomarginata]|nr:hypothetical protein B0H14DRAFT_2567128 [Mycena olivaceomarginata]